MVVVLFILLLDRRTEVGPRMCATYYQLMVWVAEDKIVHHVLEHGAERTLAISRMVSAS